MSLPDALFAPGHGARTAGGNGVGPVCPAAAPGCELPGVGPAGGVGEAAPRLLGGRADRRAGGVRQAQHCAHAGPARSPGALRQIRTVVSS
jgi:hypothetical protein